MKNLLLALTVLLAMPTFAAKWEKLDIEDSSFALLNSIDLFVSTHKLVSKKDSEPIENSLMQLTYIIRYDWGDYSMPDEIDVFPGSLDFDVLTKSAGLIAPAPLSQETLGALTEFVLFPNYDIQIFEGYDSNTFGGCANVYLLEKRSQEVAVLSLCSND